MNITQLETDLRQKQTAAKALLASTMQTCAAHIVTPATATAPAVVGRLMSDEEKGAIQKLLDEGKEIKGRIDRAQGDAAMQTEIDRLTGGLATQPTKTQDPDRSPRSLGQQFVGHDGYRQFIERGGHRVQGAWNSPEVELMAATLTSDSASGGPLILPDNRPGIIPLLFRRLVIADLIAPGTTESNLIAYMKEKTFTNAAAPVLEGGLKPESTLIFEAATSAVRKIAHWIPVTEEMLEDFQQTQSIIDARLQLGVQIAEEDQLLNGGGVAPAILGLMNLPGLSPAQARGADTNIDAIFKQMTAIALATFTIPDAFAINPLNWQTVQLTKNAQGNYLGTGPWAGPQSAMLWGIQGVVTPAIVAGTSLVGSYQTSAQIFRKGGIKVASSNSHASFFVNNLVAIRAEERLALAVYREAAFGKVTGLN